MNSQFKISKSRFPIYSLHISNQFKEFTCRKAFFIDKKKYHDDNFVWICCNCCC